MSHTSLSSVLDTVSSKAYLRSEDADPLGQIRPNSGFQNQVTVQGTAIKSTLLTRVHCFAVLQHIRPA